MYQDFLAIVGNLKGAPMSLDRYKDFNYWRPEEEMNDEQTRYYVLLVNRVQRMLKRLWNKHCDRAFIQSLDKIHSVPGVTALQRALNTIDGRSEIACSLHLPSEHTTGIFSGNNISLLVNGWVSLASNDQNNVFSGWLSGVDKGTMDRYKSSGVPRHISPDLLRSRLNRVMAELIFDRNTFTPVDSYNVKEGFVKNPRARAIIIHRNNFMSTAAEELVRISTERKLPLLTAQGKQLRYDVEVGDLVED